MIGYAKAVLSPHGCFCFAFERLGNQMKHARKGSIADLRNWSRSSTHPAATSAVTITFTVVLFRWQASHGSTTPLTLSVPEHRSSHHAARDTSDRRAARQPRRHVL